MTALDVLALDRPGTARVVVVRRWSEFLGEHRHTVYVLHADLLWSLTCTHNHRDEDAARRCVRKVAAQWQRCRTADVRVVSEGVVEWCWPTGRTAAGTVLGEYRRCSPGPVRDGVEVSDHGLATDLAGRKPSPTR